jgi:uncharacterized 2Fe-2S/4Fe-4S cluster protein (DUF4445 family)
MESGEKQFPFMSDQSLRHILDATDVRVRSGCRGTGACGLCLVRIITGDAGEPSPNERLHLDDEQLAQRIRLACRVMPEHDLEIEILSPAPPSAWKPLDRKGRRQINLPLAFPVSDLPQKIGKPYGVAVDLGTTHVSLSLHDLASGQWLAGCYGQNPQAIFGLDVMTRLVAAAESPQQAQAISQKSVEAIGEALWDMAGWEGINLQQVVFLTLVGNTAMLALLSGRNFGLLLQPSHWMSAIDCLPDDATAWAAAWNLHPQARIEVIPPVAGFVGSDLLAGVMTTNLTENEGGSLLIDFGTNSEIALWDGDVLWSTSAAGGPAFEGSGIRCGMPAEAGAIDLVTFQDGVLDYTVIGGGPPLGLCGSGLVDLIAGLVRSGELTSLGKFAPTVPRDGLALGCGEPDIVLTKADVDVFQRAKAAIGVGIQVLLATAGMAEADLRRVCVGGAFGYSLDIPNAQAIGLLPRIQPALVALCGNTALAGCEDALLSSAVRDRMKRLRSQARVINLSHYSDFDLLFLENLYLRPMRG